jgi:hypothetical protein
MENGGDRANSYALTKIGVGAIHELPLPQFLEVAAKNHC